MDTLALPHWLALGGIIISGLIFFFYATLTRKEQLSVNDYLLSSQDVSGSAFANAFTASTFSLAANIIYFICAHRDYGWLMGIGPLFFLAVQMLLLRWLGHMKLDLRQARTAADLWYSIFPSRSVARSIALIAVSTCLMAIFVELYVGSVILSVFLPSTSFFQVAAFFALGLLVLGYVRYGGFRAIVRTDKWQLALVLMSCIGITWFAYYAPTTQQSVAVIGWSEFFSYSASGSSLWAFMIWACAINFCFGFMDMTIWQRMSAAKSTQEAYTGMLKGIWKYVVVIWAPMMAFVVLGLKGHEYGSMEEFLALLLTFSGSLDVILFPMVVVGFAAALFSTADTYMIAALYGLCDKNTFGPKLNSLNETQQHVALKKYLTFFSISLLVFLSVFYYIESHDIGAYIMPIVYAVWGQISVVSPLIMYALYHRSKGFEPLVVSSIKEMLLLVALFVAWMVLIAGSLQEGITGNAYYSQVAFLLALITVCVGLSLVIKKKAREKTPRQRPMKPRLKTASV